MFRYIPMWRRNVSYFTATVAAGVLDGILAKDFASCCSRHVELNKDDGNALKVFFIVTKFCHTHALQ